MPASTIMDGHSPRRPQTPNKSHSFTRLESPRITSHLSRNRASTLQNGVSVDTMPLGLTASPLDENRKLDHDDIFEKDNLVSSPQGKVQDLNELDSPQDVPEGFDELPIEILSLVDRFIESLGAKVHNTPPSIEKLSDIFQDFYSKAEANIATHINALSTRQSRGPSPSASISSKSASIAKDGKRMQALSSKDTTGTVNLGQEQQMLTPQEISDRRKARRLLDRKGVALEEAVERRVCERVYSRIWRHRSTLDEVRDEKLRSRTAALALVGIGITDLGINFTESGYLIGASQVEEWTSKAGECLLKMNDAKFPLGKLQHLAAAHKSIVDLLTELHHSSSSADEILPTLIYTLITTPPEGINIISNLHFIQRFRASTKIDGEAAYCLVNLEAAITFLETVDLASLRPDEPPEGPPKSVSTPATAKGDALPNWPRAMPNAGSSTSTSDAPNVTSSQQPVYDHPLESPNPLIGEAQIPTGHQRKLSNLFQPPTSALGAAGDAVRTTTNTIANTLDNSFKVLFGRLKEHEVNGDGADTNGALIVPRTLEDARKLVEPKSEEEADGSRSATPIASLSEDHLASTTRSDESLLSAFAGRKPHRDRSVDSVRSSNSGKKVAFASERNSPSTGSGNGAVESMLTFGNSLNPLKGFSGFGVRGFGRALSNGPSPAAAAPLSTSTITVEKSREEEGEERTGTTKKIEPPAQHFMDLRSAHDLKIGEVAELLKDYRRLAGALKDLGAF